MSQPGGKARGDEQESRRRFLSYLTGLVGTIIFAALAIPLAAFYVSPTLAKRKRLWVSLGPIASVPEDEPTKFTYTYTRVDGWYERVVRRTAYAVRRGQEFFVLSNICTHLGCPVRWSRDAREFLCPCHNGRFNIEGKVASGPPPKPLVRFENRIIRGEIHIRVEEA